jgi:glutamate carboxypeptidase
MLAKIYPYLAERKDEMVNCLKTVVEMESPSHNKLLCDELSVKLAELFPKMTGGQCSIIENNTYGNLVRGEWGEGEEQILVLAHFDTVFPPGSLTARPFRVADGKAYGPGIFDMKGGLVQGLYALHALQALGIKTGKRVVFLFNADEEIGSPYSREIIEAEARKSKYVLVLECSMAPDGAAKTMRKGVGRFNLKITGHAVHSGVDFAKGISAIEELARQTIYLHGLTDMATGTTVNVGTVRGGTVSNVVAAEAEAEIDLRVSSMAEADKVIPRIMGLKPHLAGATVSVTGGLNRPPLERTDDVEKMYLLAKGLTGKHLGFELGEASTGGGSDGNFTAKIAPTLDGLGAVGDGAHSAEEFIIVDEMPRRSAMIGLLLASLK